MSEENERMNRYDRHYRYKQYQPYQDREPFEGLEDERQRGIWNKGDFNGPHFGGEEREEKEMTENDKIMLRELDLLDDDDCRGEVENTDEWKPQERIGELWPPERERSREKEKNWQEQSQGNLDDLVSRSPVNKSARGDEEPSTTQKRRLKKERDSSQVPEQRHNLMARKFKGFEQGQAERDHNLKLETLKKVTANTTPLYKRANSESTKPSLNLIIPKDFETKESFARRFKVLESLGEGGSSIVRKVSCRKDGKICAVKSCKSNDSNNIKYIKKELKFLKMLTHPNIIKPYGIFESASNVTFALSDSPGSQVFRRRKSCEVV